MLKIIERKDILKSLRRKIGVFKIEYKEMQRKRAYSFTIMLDLDKYQEEYRYFNMAHTLIKKNKDIDLLEMDNKSLITLVSKHKIETKWNKSKNTYAWYGSPVLDSKLREQIERIYD